MGTFLRWVAEVNINRPGMSQVPMRGVQLSMAYGRGTEWPPTFSESLFYL